MSWLRLFRLHSTGQACRELTLTISSGSFVIRSLVDRSLFVVHQCLEDRYKILTFKSGFDLGENTKWGGWLDLNNWIRHRYLKVLQLNIARSGI